MRRRYMKTLLVVVTFLLAGLPMAGCSGEVSFTTASLSEATMCLGVDSEARPVSPTDEFGVNTPEIYCSVKLSNAPDETEVLSEWVYVKGEAEGITDYTIDSVAITTDGTRYLYFSIPRPDAGWPVGEYLLNLYVDGKEEVSVSFTVSATGTTTGPGGASLSEATMCLSVDSMSMPVEATSTFAADAPEIICSVLLSNAPPGTQLLSEWYYVSGAWQGVTNQLVGEVPLIADGTRYAALVLGIPDEGWPAGQYQVKLYLNGVLQDAIPFSVEEAAISGVMCMSVDADNNPINQTTNFPVGVEKVYVVLYIKEAPAGAKLRVEWYDTATSVSRLITTYDGNATASDKPTWVNSTYGTGGWPSGQYATVVSINGERVLVLPFTVS